MKWQLLLFLPWAAASGFVHATFLSLIRCVLGDRIQNWSYLYLPCLSQSSVLRGPDKNEKTFQSSAVTAEDRQYAARCRQALLWNLLSASAQHGRWAIPAEWNEAFSFNTLSFSVHHGCFHLFHLAGLQRAAVAVIGQEITHLQGWGWFQEEIRYTG